MAPSALRFLLDQDVQISVRDALRELGHACWTASEANLGTVKDDELTVYAVKHGAVVVTHDREFSQRRRRNVVGRHLYLRCDEWRAAELVRLRLPEVIDVLRHHDAVYVAMSNAGCDISRGWE